MKTDAQKRCRKWYLANRDKAAKRASEWYRRVGGSAAQVARNHGLSLEYYKKMLKEQNGVCGMCQKHSTKTLRVDHDHATGFIRGLICSGCNFMLGFATDSEAVLLAGVDYLRRSNYEQSKTPDI